MDTSDKTSREGRTVAPSSAKVDSTPVHIRVPSTAASVPFARQQLREWMTDLGSSSDRIDEARLVFSELIANSIRHARPLPDGNLLLAWRVEDQELTVSVTDGGGPTVPRPITASASAPAGRGMAIIETLANFWWAEQTRSRCTVHACLALA